MVRELDSRTNCGTTVQLLWNTVRGGEVWLHVTDGQGDFVTRVPNAEARQAFDHPFVYEPKHR